MTMIDNIKSLRRPHPRDLDQKPFDASALAAVADAIDRRKPEDFAPKTKLPEYITPAEDVSEVGRLTAETIAIQFEETAKAVDGMGTELKTYSEHLERMLQMNDAALQHIQATVQAIRDEAKRQFERIEASSSVTAEVRTACDDMLKKLGLAVQ